jgi:iron(III) transport system substrate-binding protein
MAFTPNRRTILAGLGGVGAMSLLGVPARAQIAGLPDYYPADYSQIIEASKSENKLLVYSSMSPDSWAASTAKFKELYPWINVEILELNSVELMERYLAERGTGAPTCDFISAVAMEKWYQFIEQGEILAYDSPEKPYLPDWSNPISGLYTISVDPLIIIYNKLLIPEAKWPKSLADIAALVEADPNAFNGKIGIFGADGATSGFVGHKAYVDAKGDAAWDLFAKFGFATRNEASGGPAVEKTLSGEYSLGYFFSPGPAWLAVRDPAKAAVLGWSLIGDGQPLILRPAAIMAGAANPNAAKLWLDATMSREGQIGLAKGGRPPVRTDITAADTDGAFTYGDVVAQIGEAGIIPPSYDPAFYEGAEAFVAKWKEVFKRT